jgi:hypothetical protein
MAAMTISKTFIQRGLPGFDAPSGPTSVSSLWDLESG